MSNFTKTLVVVAAISMGAFVSQMLSGQDTDQPQQKPQRRSKPRADDPPLHHAILKKDVEPAEEKILSALDKPTNVEFVDLALEDAIKYLQDYHSINIWLNKQTLTDEGVALDQPVTLKLAEVRLESILNLLLQPLQLDWVIQDEVLKITTSAWAYQHPETRTYDIRKLIEAGHTPDELILSITKCIEPGTWTGKDATAGICHTGGVLVVRHSQRTHGEIGRLLDELDDIAAGDEEAHQGGAKNAVVSRAAKRSAARAGCIR